MIGVSVDYLTHFAFAYKHSLMREHYYKTRAVMLARAGSVGASAATTLCAVLPLLGTTMLPLRLFGVIFSVVSLVSVAIAMGFFNALLAVFGPGEPLQKGSAREILPLAGTSPASQSKRTASVAPLPKESTPNAPARRPLALSPIKATDGLTACADLGACTSTVGARAAATPSETRVDGTLVGSRAAAADAGVAVGGASKLGAGTPRMAAHLAPRGKVRLAPLGRERAPVKM